MSEPTFPHWPTATTFLLIAAIFTWLVGMTHVYTDELGFDMVPRRFVVALAIIFTMLAAVALLRWANT